MKLVSILTIFLTKLLAVVKGLDFLIVSKGKIRCSLEPMGYLYNKYVRYGLYITLTGVVSIIWKIQTNTESFLEYLISFVFYFKKDRL